MLSLSGASCPRTPAEKPLGGTAGLFTEVAEESGLHYRWEIAGKRPLNILQTIGNGCAFLDYNQDGNLDILLVGPKPALFQGDGKGKFTDVSVAVLGGLAGHFLGCAVGDYDNDGLDDLYLSAYRGGALLHNEAGKGFKDVTVASGLKPQPWGTSCTWVETVPGSGKLDLVVCNYARFGPEPGILQLCDSKDINGTPLQTSCGPRQYEPLKAALFRNQGGGKFLGETLEATTGRGLGVAACDLDGSGKPALSFANDEIAGDLLTNLGQGRFKNSGQESGVAYDRDSNVHGGMGTDWGDYDGDGKPDLIVATFQNEPKSLYHNEGKGTFTDMSFPSGLGAPSRPLVAFGVKFFDMDNDGWLDLALANGHVQDNIAKIDRSTTYPQAAQLFHNKGTSPNPLFEEATAQAGTAFAKPIVGRGLATGDFDNDGKVDLLIVDSEGEPRLLHNTAAVTNHWLGLTLVGTKSNKNAFGAIVTVETGGRTLVRHCHADGSYLSSSDARVHFGIDKNTKVDRVTIRWPSGQTDVHTELPLDKYTLITEK